MKARPSGQALVLALAGIAAAVAVSIITVQLIGRDAAPRPAQATAEAPAEPTEESLPPSLDCAFHDFMRTRAVVSFYFDVDLSTPDQPRFYERAIVTGDGKRTNFTGNDRPVWGYALDADGKPTITSQDGANRIVLYGLKLGRPGHGRSRRESEATNTAIWAANAARPILLRVSFETGESAPPPVRPEDTRAYL